MVQDDKKRTAAYVPFKTFQTALDTFREGIPPKIDASVWQSLSGGTRSQLLTAFKFLGLIDDEGVPSSDLQRLVDAEGDERKEALKETLERSYESILPLARANATATALSEAMNDLNVQGDTKDKAIRFYLQVSEFAGLPLSAHWKKPKARGPSGPRRARSGKRPPADPGQTPTPQGTEGDAKSVNLPESGGVVTLNVSAPITRLRGEERAFVFDLIDKMQDFEQGQEPEQTTEEETQDLDGGEAEE